MNRCYIKGYFRSVYGLFYVHGPKMGVLPHSKGKSYSEKNDKLVGGLEHFIFFNILGTIIPFDKYFSEGLKPPTSKPSNFQRNPNFYHASVP